MRVLGISPLDKDATASFVEDGEILFACGEERLSRTKLQDGFPMRAVKMGLERTGWTLDSIDVVAYSFYDGAKEAELMNQAMLEDERYHEPGDTQGSLAALRAINEAGYTANLHPPIPGLDRDKEFADANLLGSSLLAQTAARPKGTDGNQEYFLSWQKNII